MSVSLRLSRGGSKKRPYYKVVVSNSRAPRDGKYLEQVGTYNPLLAKDCLLYTSPSPRDRQKSRMPSSA